MKTTLDYVTYFETLATSATFVDLFYYGHDEFKENADTAEGTVFVLEPYSNPFSQNQNDNTLAERRGTFIVLKPYDSDLSREYAAVEDACEKLCYKIVGKMKCDSAAGVLTLDILNWEGSGVAPMVGNWIGYMIEFTFETPINSLMKYLAEDWDE